MIKIKIIPLLIFIMLCGVSYAQTQHAVVKTPMRRNVDGKMSPAKYWDNATVTIMTAEGSSEQSYVSGNGGKVGFPAPKPFYVVGVSANKGAFALLDGQFKGKRLSYSATELDILVDDPEALAHARAEGERLMGKRLRNSIREKEDEIERLLEEKKITEVKYRELADQLREERNGIENRISEIVNAYLSTDFEKLDNFNKELFIAVEDGDVARVDSLLKTQHSCEAIFNEIKSEEAAIKQSEEQTALAKEGTQKKKEAFFQRLYTEYLNFIQRPLMQDSALHRLKMRADLDTTNAEAAQDYADLCYKQKKFSDCEKYYFICLRAYQQNKDMPNTATIQYNLGRLYLVLCDYANSEKYLKMALEIIELLFKENPDDYREDLANTQNAFGVLYNYLHDYTNSEKYNKQALENKEQLFKANPDAYRAALAAAQDNLGSLYCILHDYTNSEKYGKMALENREYLFKANPDAYRADLAKTQNNLGVLYYNLHDYANSEKYYKLALENIEQLFKENPDVYRVDLANTQNNLGTLYIGLHDYANRVEYYKLAIENYELLFRDYPDAYRAALAAAQDNLGSLYCILHDYTNSEKYGKMALENREYLFKANPDAYRADLAMTQHHLGNLYKDLHDYANSEKYYKLALENRKYLFKANPDAYREDLAMTQGNLGILYYDFQDYANSEKYYKLELENFEHLFNANPDAYREDLAMTQGNLGNLYYDFQDYANSEKYYKLALENRKYLFKANPDAYREDLAMTQGNLGNLYYDFQDYANSEKYYKLALENFEHLFNANPDAYRADLAKTQDNLGNLFFSLHDYANSEKYHKLAFEKLEYLFEANPDVYRKSLAKTYYNVMAVYVETYDIKRYDTALARALELYKTLYRSQPTLYLAKIVELQNRTIWRMLMNDNVNEALALAKETFFMDELNEQSKYYLAVCYNEEAYAYARGQRFNEALKSIDKALSLEPTGADFYNSKGAILLMQGKEKEALAMWKKVLELNPNFLKDYPEGTKLSNGLRERGLIAK